MKVDQKMKVTLETLEISFVTLKFLKAMLIITKEKLAESK